MAEPTKPEDVKKQAAKPATSGMSLSSDPSADEAPPAPKYNDPRYYSFRELTDEAMRQNQIAVEQEQDFLKFLETIGLFHVKKPVGNNDVSKDIASVTEFFKRHQPTLVTDLGDGSALIGMKNGQTIRLKENDIIHIGAIDDQGQKRAFSKSDAYNMALAARNNPNLAPPKKIYINNASRAERQLLKDAIAQVNATFGSNLEVKGNWRDVTSGFGRAAKAGLASVAAKRTAPAAEVITPQTAEPTKTDQTRDAEQDAAKAAAEAATKAAAEAAEKAATEAAAALAAAEAKALEAAVIAAAAKAAAAAAAVAAATAMEDKLNIPEAEKDIRKSPVVGKTTGRSAANVYEVSQDEQKALVAFKGGKFRVLEIDGKPAPINTDIKFTKTPAPLDAAAHAKAEDKQTDVKKGVTEADQGQPEEIYVGKVAQVTSEETPREIHASKTIDSEGKETFKFYALKGEEKDVLVTVMPDGSKIYNNSDVYILGDTGHPLAQQAASLAAAAAQAADTAVATDNVPPVVMAQPAGTEAEPVEVPVAAETAAVDAVVIAESGIAPAEDPLVLTNRIDGDFVFKTTRDKSVDPTLASTFEHTARIHLEATKEGPSLTDAQRAAAAATAEAIGAHKGAASLKEDSQATLKAFNERLAAARTLAAINPQPPTA